MPDVDIPNEVASQSFLNQSTALTATTVYTPASTMLLRVSVYLDAASGTPPTITVSYTDPATGSQTYQFPVNNSFGVAGDNFGVLVIRASGSTNVQVSAPAPTVTYNLFVTVEQL